MSRAARFGAALAMLWSAHDLADHVVQTDAQAQCKASHWGAMAGHVGTYTAVQVAALAALRPLGVRPTLGRLAAAVAWSAATHALLDRRWPVVAVLRATGSPAFAESTVVPAVLVERTADAWRRHTGRHDMIGITENPRLPLHGPYLADQALHHAALTVSALILAGGR